VVAGRGLSGSARFRSAPAFISWYKLKLEFVARRRVTGSRSPVTPLTWRLQQLQGFSRLNVGRVKALEVPRQDPDSLAVQPTLMLETARSDARAEIVPDGLGRRGFLRGEAM
jgi:hypothetical protein